MSVLMPQAGSGTTGKPGRAGTSQCTCQVASTAAPCPLDLFELKKAGLLPELFAVGHPWVRGRQVPTCTNKMNVSRKGGFLLVRKKQD